MKFSICALALLAAAVAATSSEMRRYIVSFDPDTDDSVVREAMKEAKKNGAKITHQYSIIKGFSVDAPNEDAVSFVTSLGSDKKYSATVEEDQIVTTQRSKKSRSG